MSLLGSWLKRFRTPSRSIKRARRLFLEPLEGRQLMAVDLRTTKVADGPAVAGDATNHFSYTITVTNVSVGAGGGGDEAAVNVRLRDIIPAKTVFVEMQLPRADWTFETQPLVGATEEEIVVFLNTPLDLDQTQTFRLIVDVLPNERGDIVNEAGATTDSNEANTGNDSSGQITTPIEVRSELSIDKTGPAQVDAGGLITYTIEVINFGPSDAIGATITDAFPGTLTNVSYTSTTTANPLPNPFFPTADDSPTGNTPGPTSGNIADTVTMPAGTIVRYTVTANAPQSGSVLNEATVTVPAGTVDPGTFPNTDTVTTNVIFAGPTTDLRINKVSTGTTAIPGTDIVYTITVNNDGAAVTGARVTDTFSLTNFSAVSYTSVSTLGATSNPAQRTGDINDLVDMPAGSSITYTVTARIRPGATGTLSNSATVAPPDGTLDTNTANNTEGEDDTLAPRAEITITKSDGDPDTTAIPGQPITYTIIVSNLTGPSDITGARLLDTFPLAQFTAAGVTFSSTPELGASSTVPSGNGNIDALLTLPVGSRITYTVNGTIRPDATGSLNNTATVTLPAGATDPTTPNSATDLNTLVPTADLSIDKSNTLTSITPGGPINYVIVVRNNGPNPVTGATIEDLFPSTITNVNWTSTPSGGATGNTAASSGNINETVNLPVNAFITYNVTATVSASATVSITNTATVDEPAGVTDPNQENNSDFKENSLPNVDVAVTKTDNLAGPVNAGDTITYTITVSNPGTIALAGLALTDAVPNGTTLVRFEPPANWTRTDSVLPGQAGQLRATRAGTLAANASEQFLLEVRVGPGAANNSQITNIAQVTTTTAGETDTADNTATRITSVQTRADLVLQKSDSPQTVGAGDPITYTITVTNNGPSNATSLTLTDTIPTGTTFRSLNAPGWTFTPPPVGGTGTITANNPSLAPGATSTLTLIVDTDSNLDIGTSIQNTASVTSTTTDPNSLNNADTETTSVNVLPDYGDAPASYGTLSVDAGAQHGGSLLRLGQLVDSESDGQPSDTASGDDSNNIDDEDGVVLPGALIVSRPAAALVTSSGTGRLDAWIDFNRNGVFDASEQIASSLLVEAGTTTVFYTVPADAQTGVTYARFRLSSSGGLGPTGVAGDGEVEDYATNIIVVQPGTVGVIPDPESPGQNMLLIAGTSANEVINVTQVRTHRLKVQVNVNNRSRGQFNMANFRRIAAFAGAGNDTVTIGLARPALILGEDGNDRITGHGGYDQIFGGAGRDTINGGAGDDFLFGEDGNDSLNGGDGNDALLGGLGNDALSGGKGRDVLIGGVGADAVAGGAGDDILIGGTTTFDEDRAALAQIMANWIPKNVDFHSRVNALGTTLNSTTVTDDGERDRIDGSLERDWYIDYLLADNNVGFSGKQDRRN